MQREGKKRLSRRAAMAEETRRLILDAAADQFAAVGYAATTLEAVAARAGVAVQTVYNSVGNKAALLRAAFEYAVRGPAGAAPVPEQMRERAGRTRTAWELVELLADWFAEANARTAGLWGAIDGGASDPDVREFARKRSLDRLGNYGEAARALRARGGVRPGVTDEDFAALLWGVGHPTVYRTLVLERGWPVDRYRAWVRSALGGMTKGCDV